MTPALFTSTFKVPSLSAAAKRARISASLATSPLTATALPPADVMDFTTASAAVALAVKLTTTV